jgi:[histone H3]-lysine4 N-trimethyltransferase ASH1L
MVAGTKDEDSSSEGVSASTPPTSFTESGSLGSAKAAVEPMDVIEGETSRRPKRQRSSVSTYNLQKLSGAQEEKSTGSKRNISGLTGRTLVDDEEESPYGNKTDKVMNSMDWEETPPPVRRSPRTIKMQRRPSIKDRVKKAAGRVGSVLGKRSREVMEAGKRKLGMSEIEESPQAKKILKELDTGSRGVLDEMDLSDEEFVAPARPAKRAKTSAQAPLKDVDQTVAPTAPPLNITSGKRTKKWQKEGLYVGQDPSMDPAHVGVRKKPQKKRPDSSSSHASEMTDATTSRRSFMTLPMFRYLDKTRDFTIPYDIYAPSFRKGDEKPKDWKQINKNRLVGEARDLWERSEKLPSSACVCQCPQPGEQGCEDDCLNRVMQYECNDDNCNLAASQCSNRAFAELAARTKKGGAFDLGVEVIKTSNRGFGVRSCRTFASGQIIMEYTGEIISEAECQRRMREDYKDKQCYYLMELERGLIIDGTKGSMARFINHSCNPNCEVRMVKVNGTPRMAVFAGENGVMTGEELTYDYNFDNFGTTRQICYCGAENCRGFLSKRLNAAEQKKQAKEEIERRKQAAEEARKRAQAEARKKQVQDDRGSSWRGWIAVDDPEVKEKLRAEKKEKEEAEKNTSRARRLAARLSGVPLTETNPPTPKREPAKRRKSTQVPKEEPENEPEGTIEQTTIGASVTKTTTRKKHLRTTSTGSKFTEELSHSSSMQTLSTTVKETEVSISTTEIHKETTRTIDEAPTLAEADPQDREDSTEIPETVSSAESEIQVAEKSGRSRTASKGKGILKGVGQAVKKSFLGLEKSSGNGIGAGKLKQSKLNFARINS